MYYSDDILSYLALSNARNSFAVRLSGFTLKTRIGTYLLFHRPWYVCMYANQVLPSFIYTKTNRGARLTTGMKLFLKLKVLCALF